MPLLAGCGMWQRVGTPEQAPGPAQTIPVLTDQTDLYRGMGLMTDNSSAIGFVGALRLFAAGSPDTELMLTTLSLHNRGFAFHRDGASFVAEYRVEIAVREQAGVTQQASQEERIRVSSFRETQRVDESVIFQNVLPVPAGQYTVSVTVRDKNGPATAHAEQQLSVPPRRMPAVAVPVAVYEAHPRSRYAEALNIVTNPRDAVAVGGDTLRFYVESYGLEAGAPLTVSAVDINDRAGWSDTVRVPASDEVQSFVVQVPTEQLSLGRYDFRMSQGSDVLATAPMLITFSDEWAVGNFDDMVSLLRYFPAADTLRKVQHGTPEQRAAAWRKMWKDSDPNPATPENEALDQYFARVHAANQEFRDEGIPGWLTDRGEVLIGLGEPDQVIEPRPDIRDKGRFIQWTYDTYRITLYFIDDTGFGRLRLDPRSRAEFQRVLIRVQNQ